jgi:hypothetical protein
MYPLIPTARFLTAISGGPSLQFATIVAPVERSKVIRCDELRVVTPSISGCAES